MKYTTVLSVVLGLLAVASAGCQREQPNDLPGKVSPDEAVPAGTIDLPADPALAENQVDLAKRIEKQMAEDEAIRRPPAGAAEVPMPPARPSAQPDAEVAPPSPPAEPETPPATTPETPAAEPQVEPEQPEAPPAEPQTPPVAPEEPAPEEGGFEIPAG